ncbi:MAG: hypothetical protein ACRC1Z_22030 [Waterburya sp.]
MLGKPEHFRASIIWHRNSMEIIVGKNRNGSTGSCEVKFDPSIGRYS